MITPSDLELTLHILYIIGIVAESMTGTIAAGNKKMDLFGVVTISVITALGGGSIRNMILGVYPLTWVASPSYVLIAIFAALVALPLVKVVIRLRNLFLILDAAGLVTFAYLGSIVGFKATHSITIATLMAIITGVSGGVMRDILCNDIPLVFRSELYATVAFVVGLIQSLLLAYWYNSLTGTLALLVAGFAFRLFALYKNLHLPVINYQNKGYYH